MQSLYLFRSQRNRRIAPPEGDIGMMALCLRELADVLDETQRLAKVAESKASLDPVSVVAQLPVRHLDVEALGFPLRQWRDAAAAGSAGFISQSIHHAVIPVSHARRSISQKTMSSEPRIADTFPK